MGSQPDRTVETSRRAVDGEDTPSTRSVRLWASPRGAYERLDTGVRDLSLSAVSRQPHCHGEQVVSAFVPWTGAQWKPTRGAAMLQREKDDADRKAVEVEVAKAVKERDKKCRWPERHKCRGALEAAHIIDKSKGGDTATRNELALCAWIHRRGPESVHGKQLRVDCETPQGADGALSFWRQTGEYDALGQPVYHCVAREVQRGVLERD